MPKRKPGLSFERHQEIGEELKRMQRFITSLCVEFSNAYPLSGRMARPYKSLSKVDHYLSEARCWAEENLATEYPDQFTTDIYYGRLSQSDDNPTKNATKALSMVTREDFQAIIEKYPHLSDWGLADKCAYKRNKVGLEESRESLKREFEGFLEACKWLKERKYLKYPGKYSSYGWKHVMERETGIYVTNGAFIAAALHLEIPYKQVECSPNPVLGIRKTTKDVL